MTRSLGLLFDLDGVLTDTARYHYLAWKRLAEELGLAFGEADNERLKGVDRLRSLEIILEINGALDRFTQEEQLALAQRKNGYYREFIGQITPGDVLPGIREFLDEAQAGGILTAVASASKNAGFVLERLGLAGRFDYVADAALVARAKPDPEIFLVCAQALGLRPDQCIGIEDSQAGIEAILGAGMFAVGINVHVTSAAPDLALRSTGELALDRVLLAAGHGEQGGCLWDSQ